MMSDTRGLSMADARGLERRLRSLGDVRAPDTILPTVLNRLGIGDAYARLDTSLGPVYVAYSRAGISAVMRADDDAGFERAFRARFGRPVRPGGQVPAAVSRICSQPADRTARRSLRFDLGGLSEFERAVLLKALEIPPGEVRTYAWVAREIGRPKAVRAVGTALARNPIPLLIPCHRVVRSDCRIGDYAFGSEAKRAALKAEGVEPEVLERLARSGVRYYGSDTTRIYCFPTCRNARRIAERHRVSFNSEPAASAAGYRPCAVCRPAVRAS
jgi:O-6-methylguanine DNA methyltransferase